MRALKAGARERTWIRLTCRRRAKRARRTPLARIVAGSLAWTGSRISSDPASLASDSNAPPRVAISEPAPARATARAVSSVTCSTPPPSIRGVTCRRTNRSGRESWEMTGLGPGSGLGPAEHRLHGGAGLVPGVGRAQGEGDVGAQQANRISAVVGRPLVLQGVEGLGRQAL